MGCRKMRLSFKFCNNLVSAISNQFSIFGLNVNTHLAAKRRMTDANEISFLSQADAISLDKELFSTYAFSVDQLMELAGLSCAHAVANSFNKAKVLVLCGPGNNGGDGFVCARHLKLFGFEPYIYYPKQSQSELMKRLVTQTQKMNILHLDESIIKSPLDMKTKFNLVVDALFGFSFKPPLRQPFDQLIDAVNKSSLPVVAVDIPSGWDVEKGPLDGQLALNPDILVSLTAPKLCAKYFRGQAHYIGGRFVPEALASKYNLRLPDYPGTDCIVKLL
ncbi:unnamed protein product [Thelazia callipaeda]|uniref:NAD(P)H-hydrate epimerase n=1 Tax=Thelazia callipaeda TaxID=103827 RepID=A0A0N5CU70_THECL|nr:unnamed protein product [Thelazia callipaeda]